MIARKRPGEKTCATRCSSIKFVTREDEAPAPQTADSNLAATTFAAGFTDAVTAFALKLRPNFQQVPPTDGASAECRISLLPLALRNLATGGLGLIHFSPHGSGAPIGPAHKKGSAE